MSMGGGSGGSGNQTNTFTPPDWTRNQWTDLTQAATTLYSQPQQQYGGQRIAGINDTQAMGMQYLADLSGNTSPDMAAMRRNLQITASGGFENPYAIIPTNVGSNPYMDAKADVGWNPYIDPQATTQGLDIGNPYLNKRTSVGQNQYEGFGSQYQQFKDNAMSDVVKQYQTAIAPQTDAAFNHAGAFHAGGHDAAIANNQNALAQNLGRMSTEMDQGQWNRSGDLRQQGINLDVQAQQGDYGRNVGAYQNWAQLLNSSAQQDRSRNTAAANQWLQMQNQSNQTDLSRNANTWQQGIQLGLQAQQADLDRSTNAWDAERNRQMGAFNPILQANQFDQQNARNLMGIGDIQRGYSQDLLNMGYQDWQQQMNYPQQMLDAYANMLARASGNYGQNMSIYQQPGYQANPFATAVGLGTVGAGLYNSMGG